MGGVEIGLNTHDHEKAMTTQVRYLNLRTRRTRGEAELRSIIACASDRSFGLSIAEGGPR